MTNDIIDVKAALTGGLNELHLPTVRRIYEEAARLAERETLSYERYLLDLSLLANAKIANRSESSDFCDSLAFLQRKHSPTST